MGTAERIPTRRPSRRSTRPVLGTAASIAAVVLGVVAATGCAPVSFGETSNLRVSEVWPSHGPAAHVDAAL